ncbi:hypothetical protein BOTBODRAFT_137247 [Botryobasidium botryosum FD-172 SS1]|uniref:holo-[acyl-carrier-protein] synthase n=1 Tax=Botryobasidium botryosum (strain FD-172 SS1) TaxID=930990 RepID=A0A067M5J1_BOTB1|nr:hypothetical protein BOTBODRAFT_137247 [Botryobasidium botryosum FD-172 SS1]
MELWLVNIPFQSGVLTDQLYERALRCVSVESQNKIKRFYRRQDAWRSLIGRLLIRTLLEECDVPSHSVVLGATAAGKLYLASPRLTPYLAFNITHDSSLVGMSYNRGDIKSDAEKVGVDVMKVALPGNETISSFLEILRDQLSPLERSLLAPIRPYSSSLSLPLPATDDESLSRIFWIWTLKEAYTKALGIGLGFDFSRVEFNFLRDEVKVDGVLARGWEFRLFSLGLPPDNEGRTKAVTKDGLDLYQGVVATWIGGDECRVTRTQYAANGENQWYKMVTVQDIIGRATAPDAT